MKTLAIGLISLLCITANAGADDLATAIAGVEKAWMGNEHAARRATIQPLKAIHDAAPDARDAYALGYAERRLAFMTEVPAGERKALLEDAVVRFEEVSKLD